MHIHNHQKVRTVLEMAQRKGVYARHTVSSHSSSWLNDLGRNLANYSRVHSFILQHFKTHGLKGLAVTHFGAGNGKYMHFLGKHYGIATTAIESSGEHIQAAHAIGVRPGFKRRNAHNTKLPSNSQDIVLSDHFVLAHCEGLNDEKILREAHRVLKPGGLLVVERATTKTLPAKAKKLFAQVNDRGFDIGTRPYANNGDLAYYFFVLKK